MSQTEITVPLLNLRAQYESIRDEIAAAIAPVIESQYFVLGPTVEAFEQSAAEYVNARHAIGCASGSDALLLPLMAWGVGPGDEVICPTFTFFATASAISRLGARPVFCDIDPITYNLSPNALSECVEQCESLRAIIPVHLYGQSADMRAIHAIAQEAGVPVLEDAAQAIGASDNEGNRIGSTGLAHAWSFYPTKNLNAFGDAGMVTVNEDDLAALIRRLRVHGGLNRYFHDVVGVNSRLDAIQAAVLQTKLHHLDSWNARRRRHASHYDGAFAQAGAKSSAHGWSAAGLPLRFPHAENPEHHVYHQYVIRVPGEIRDELRAHLTANNIGNEVFYPLPLHLQECFAPLGGSRGDCPVAEQVVDEVIALPIYPELTDDQLNHVTSTIIAFVESHASVRARG